MADVIYKDYFYRWGIFPLWLLLAATVYLRTPIPTDETRYLTVAWEMWLRGDFWVPYLNNHAYSHKPPLLFWLFQLGWWVFGVNDWWPKLVGPLCALANLLLTRKLAEKLWPELPASALLAPWILIATLLWSLFATAAMFDILLTCWLLLAMLGLLELLQGAKYKGGVMIAFAIGFGLLTKGPVIFLYFCPTALLVGFWSKQEQTGFCLNSLLVALLTGIWIALGWAIPAAIAGGDDYAHSIFWQQVSSRTINTEIHVRPWFWYMPFLPLVLFPWVCWPRIWQNCSLAACVADKGLRFCMVWLCASLLIFSWLPSKQIHYLLPMLPAFALLTARILSTAKAPPVGLLAEMVLPVVFVLVGGFLILLPQTPGLSNLHWVQTIRPAWGMAVIAIALALGLKTLYLRRLTPAAVSITLVAAVFAGFGFFFQYNGLAYNLSPAAQQLKTFTQQGVPYAFVGNYQGQLQFLGRLIQPMPILSANQVAAWAGQHVDGYLISVEKQKPVQAFYLQPHREYWLVIRSAGEVEELKPL